jgi:hypothetical protein
MAAMKTVWGRGLALLSVAALPGCTMVPDEALIACQNGIATWAEQYDPKRIDTVSAGRGDKAPNGNLVTPLHVRIVYPQEGGFETKQAQVQCTVNEEGAVVAVMDPPAAR